MIFQSIVTRRVDRSHLYCGDRGDAVRDRFADGVIDVALRHQIARQLIVCRERTVCRILRRYQRDDVFKVSFRASFAHEQMHAES